MDGNHSVYRFFGYRYLVCFTAFFLSGTAISIISGAAERNFNFAWIAVIAALISAAVCILKFGSMKLGMKIGFMKLGSAAIIIIYCAAFIFGLIYPSLYNQLFYGKLKNIDGDYGTVYGRIVSEPALSSSEKTVTALVKTERIELGDTLIDSKTKMRVYLPSDSDVKYGDGIKLEGKLSRPEEEINGFKYRLYLLTSGCYLISFADEYSEYTPDVTLWDRFCGLGFVIRSKINEYSCATFENSELSGLLTGILIGDKSGLSDETYANMSKSGFMHIAAVSGLHIGFLCGFMLFVLRFFERRIRVLFIIPLLLIYMSAASFTPSVDRAVIMLCMILVSWLIFKSSDTLTSLFAAALLLCVINPYVLFSISFMMSFAATFYLIMFMTPVSVISAHCCGVITKNKKLFTILCSLLGFLIVPIICQMGITPISAYYFGNVSFLSFIGNIIVVPCTMLVFVAGLAGTAVFCFFPQAAVVLGKLVIYVPLKLIYTIAEFFSRFSYSPAYKPMVLSVLFYYVLTAVLYIILINIGTKIKAKT